MIGAQTQLKGIEPPAEQTHIPYVADNELLGSRRPVRYVSPLCIFRVSSAHAHRRRKNGCQQMDKMEEIGGMDSMSE